VWKKKKRKKKGGRVPDAIGDTFQNQPLKTRGLAKTRKNSKKEKKGLVHEKCGLRKKEEEKPILKLHGGKKEGSKKILQKSQRREIYYLRRETAEKSRGGKRAEKIKSTQDGALSGRSMSAGNCPSRPSYDLVLLRGKHNDFSNWGEKKTSSKKTGKSIRHRKAATYVRGRGQGLLSYRLKGKMRSVKKTGKKFLKVKNIKKGTSLTQPGKRGGEVAEKTSQCQGVWFKRTHSNRGGGKKALEEGPRGQENLLTGAKGGTASGGGGQKKRGERENLLEENVL